MAWPRDHSTTALIGVGGIYETGSLCPEVTGSPLGAGQGLHGAHGLYDGHGGHSITTRSWKVCYSISQSSEPTVLVSRWVTVLKGLCCDQRPTLPSLTTAGSPGRPGSPCGQRIATGLGQGPTWELKGPGSHLPQSLV